MEPDSNGLPVRQNHRGTLRGAGPPSAGAGRGGLGERVLHLSRTGSPGRAIGLAAKGGWGRSRNSGGPLPRTVRRIDYRPAGRAQSVRGLRLTRTASSETTVVEDARRG